MYLLNDHTLRISTICQLASCEYTVGIFSKLDGKLQANEYHFISALTPFDQTLEYIFLGGHEIENIIIYPTTLPSYYGAIFSKIEVCRGGQTAPIPLFLLNAGCYSSSVPLCFPEIMSQRKENVPFLNIVGQDVGLPGAPWLYTPPAGFSLIINSIIAQFLTSAALPTRTVYFSVVEPGPVEFYKAYSQYDQVANALWEYQFTNATSFISVASNFVQIGIQTFNIDNTKTLNIAAVALDIGDVFGLVKYNFTLIPM